MFDVLFSFVLTFFASVGIAILNDVPPSFPASEVNVSVVAVIDGDTIEVVIDGKPEKVRYIGIDTPEPYRDDEPACFSREATAENKRLVGGKKVTLVSDREDKDKYGRLLRYVYVGDRFVNAKLIEEGFAKTLLIKPNLLHADEFAESQKEAKEIGKGLWGACEATSTAR